MNKILIILSFVILASCAPNEVPSKDLIERQGLTYEVNSQTPFSGVSVEYYLDTILKNEFEDRVLLQRTIFKKGIKNGLYESFHLNGQLKVKENFKDGKEDGLSETYDENGQLSQKGNYKDGKRDGLWESYHDNGQLQKKENYKKDGTQDGLETYHDNGQLSSKANFKDGGIDGLWEWYHENGQLRSKTCYKNYEKTDMSYCEK